MNPAVRFRTTMLKGSLICFIFTIKSTEKNYEAPEMNDAGRIGMRAIRMAPY